MKPDFMKLDIDRQDYGRSEIEISGTLALDMGEDRPGTATVQGTLIVDNLETRFLLNGKVKASGQSQCGRCLEDFQFEWDVPVDIMIMLQQERNQDPDEGQNKTMILHQNRGEVDLSETLTECLVLAFPIATVCSEECKGLCSSCGIDLNRQSCECTNEDFDPRWAALDALENEPESK